MIQGFWYFILYSFLGFLLEIAFAKWAGGEKHRKCRVLLPLCPVYGFGALLLLALPEVISGQIVLLFCFGVIIASTVEFITGIFYSQILSVSFWDYSNLPCHYCGQICLYFSLAWGGLSIALLHLLQPVLTAFVTAIPNRFFLPAFYLFLLDTGFSLCLLRKYQTTEVLQWSKLVQYLGLTAKHLH